jgi:hypothetical protein
MEASSVPPIFLPLPLRSGYRNLSHHKFSLVERNFLVGELNGVTAYLPRNTRGSVGAADISRLFKISASTIRSWHGRDGNPEVSVTGEDGRPELLDAQGKTNIRESVSNLQKKRKCIFNWELANIIKVQKVETEKRRGKTVDESSGMISVRDPSVAKVKQELNIVTKHAQSITDARLVALGSIRVIYKWASLLYELTKNLPGENKFNADATTFQFYPDNTGGKVNIIRGNDDKSPVTSVNLPSDTCVFVKWMHLCNAVGDMGPLVYIIQIDGLEKDTFEKFEIPGLACLGSNLKGVVYFCSSRAGNHALWMDWFLYIVIPYMAESSKFYDLKVTCMLYNVKFCSLLLLCWYIIGWQGRENSQCSVY